MVAARNVLARFQRRVSRPSHTLLIALSVQAKSNPTSIDLSSSDPADIESTVQGGRLPASRYVLFLALMISGALADLITKTIVFRDYFQPQRMMAGLPQRVHWWVDGIFGLQTSTNPGALFGFGKGYSFVFAIVSFFAIAGILFWLFFMRQAMSKWITFALGCVTGGIIGNLYDRLGFGWVSTYPEQIKDNVRDWIYFRLEGVPFFDPWPNFNIADCLLVCGAIMLFLHAIFVPVDPPQDKKQ